jgi:xyloglucan:xyloglucosyl transferase
MGRQTPPLVVVVVHALLAAVSALPAINVTTMAFEDGYAPLFGHGNILRSADHRTVSLLLDRSTGDYCMLMLVSMHARHALSIAFINSMRTDDQSD